MKVSILVFALGLMAASAHAGLVDTINDSTSGLAGGVDGILGADEYGAGNAQRALGSGSGFGGTVGNGALYLDASGSDLKIGFQPGANLNDILVLYFDTRAGGFTDATMSDEGDNGRRAITNPLASGTLVFDAGFLPDYGLAIDGNGIGVFELASPGLIYQTGDFSSAFNRGGNTNFREIVIPKSVLSLGSSFDFTGIYTASSSYMSNETIPGGNISGDNPGFGPGGPVNALGYDRFQAVPEPASMLALGVGAAAVLRRRRK